MTQLAPSLLPFVALTNPPTAPPDGPALLNRLRLGAGLSQNQLARAARIDPAYVNRIERRLGSHTPSRAVILRLTDALELDLDQGDRLLHAFGLAGRVDWQSAWLRFAATLAPAVAEAAQRTLADAIVSARASADTSEPDG